MSPDNHLQAAIHHPIKMISKNLRQDSTALYSGKILRFFLEGSGQETSGSTYPGFHDGCRLGLVPVHRGHGGMNGFWNCSVVSEMENGSCDLCQKIQQFSFSRRQDYQSNLRSKIQPSYCRIVFSSLFFSVCRFARIFFFFIIIIINYMLHETLAFNNCDVLLTTEHQQH